MRIPGRPFRLLLGLLALTFAVAAPMTLTAAPIAGAQSYTPPAIDTKPVTDPNGSMTLTGSGFIPGSTVVISIDGKPIGTTTVAPNGTFSFNFTAPANIGAYQISATDGSNSLTTIFRVETGGGGGGGLPYTGSSSSSWLLRLGVGLLAVGAVLVALVRTTARRRTHERVDA